jgi:hypothetical protein
MTLKMKINWKKALDIIDTILMVLGFIFLTVLVHELVHMIDGYSENIAVCYGFIDWKRSAFVINGDNYTLFRGEPLAFLANIIIFTVIVIIYRKARLKN